MSQYFKILMHNVKHICLLSPQQFPTRLQGQKWVLVLLFMGLRLNLASGSQPGGQDPHKRSPHESNRSQHESNLSYQDESLEMYHLPQMMITNTEYEANFFPPNFCFYLRNVCILYSSVRYCDVSLCDCLALHALSWNSCIVIKLSQAKCPV